MPRRNEYAVASSLRQWVEGGIVNIGDQDPGVAGSQSDKQLCHQEWPPLSVGRSISPALKKMGALGY